MTDLRQLAIACLLLVPTVLFGQDTSNSLTINLLKERQDKINHELVPKIVSFTVDLKEPAFYKNEKYSRPPGNGLLFIGKGNYSYTVQYQYPSEPKYSAKETHQYSEQDYDAMGRLIISRTKVREGKFSSESSILFIAQNLAISPDDSIQHLLDTETLIKVDDYQDDQFMLWLLTACAIEVPNWIENSSDSNRNSKPTAIIGRFSKAWTDGQWTIELDETSSLIRRAQFSIANGTHLLDVTTTGVLRIQNLTLPAEASIKTADSSAKFEIKTDHGLNSDSNTTAGVITQNLNSSRTQGCVFIDQSAAKQWLTTGGSISCKN